MESQPQNPEFRDIQYNVISDCSRIACFAVTSFNVAHYLETDARVCNARYYMSGN